MPRRSELGWILVMVVVAVTLGFFIGGGPSLLRGSADEGVGQTVAASEDTSTTTTDAEATTTTTTEPVVETSTTSTSIATRPVGEVAVRVYNGSTKPGQAVRVGDRLKIAGYNVLAPGPSPGDTRATSIIHFADGFEGEAAALLSLLELPPSAAEPMPKPPPVTGVGPANLVLIVADDLVAPA